MFLTSKFKLILLGTILIFLGACKTIKIVNNSFANKQSIPQGFIPGSSFCIKFTYTDNPLIPKNIAEMIASEAAEKIAKILQTNGYVIRNSKTADYNLVFSFGMTKSINIVNVPVYMPGQTQIKNGNILDNSGEAVQYQEETQTSGKVVYVPQECTVYNKNLVAQIYDARLQREANKEKQVWLGSADSSNESSDIRDIMDYLLVSTFKYFGKNTQRIIATEMHYDNKEVKKLRKND